MLFTDIENTKISFKTDIESFFNKYSNLHSLTFQRCQKKINKKKYTTLYLSEINIKKDKKIYKMYDFSLFNNKKYNNDLMIIWNEINEKILSHKYNSLSIDSILIIEKNSYINAFNSFLGSELLNKIKSNDLFYKLNSILPNNNVIYDKTKV